MPRYRVIEDDGVPIYNNLNGQVVGHYDCGEIIRTLEMDKSRSGNDGRLYAPYTVGGVWPHRYHWIPVEDTEGNALVEYLGS